MLRYSAFLLTFCAVSSPAAEQVNLKIKDYAGRGFAPDLVQYTLGAKAPKPPLQVLNAEKKEIPAQISTDKDGRQTLSFVAELAPDQDISYQVKHAKTATVRSGIKIQTTTDGLEISNGLLAVRTPAPTKKQFKKSVAASTLPAPVLAFQSGKNVWLGHSRVLTARHVAEFSVKQMATGPVFVDVLYEIKWAGGGWYRARIRVIDRVPVVKIRESYDLGALDGSDFWELQLATGWNPDQMEIAHTHGNGSGIDRGHVEKLANLTKRKNPRITPDTCPPSLSQLGIFNAAEKKTSPAQYTMAGFVPLHKGDWRKMNAVPVRSKGPHDVRILLPMTARNANWLVDSDSETSPFSMQEHDPDLPKTYGRRVWGLALGAPKVKNAARSTVRYSYFQAPQPLKSLGPFAQIRSFYGVIGLNRYKDYILNWPDAGVRHSQLYKRPETPKETTSKRFWAVLKGTANAYSTCPVISHHLTVGAYILAARADAILANPATTPADRKRIRSYLALIMYLYEEADFISYGNGAHTGNPNMGTSRYMGANAFLPLLADHPMFKKWRHHVAGYTEYKMASQMAPGGAYLEFGASYHMHGYSRTTNSLPGLISAGAPNVKKLYDYHKQDWEYVMNLLTPKDPRVGARLLPGLANANPAEIGHLREAAGSFTRMNPEFAGNLLWAWEEDGKPGVENPYIVPPKTIKPIPYKLTSRVYPGFGVIFRAHQGPKETYMLLRCGFNWSHWYIDQGQMVLMSRGSILLPCQPYAYWTSPKKKEFDLYNLIRFGDKSNEYPYDWPDDNILDYAFGPTVDYAWASIGIPDWFIDPSINPKLKGKLPPTVVTGMERKLDPAYQQKQGAFEWNRQVMFLKGKTADSPNYFVIRDTMPGDGKLASWFFLNFLGTEKNVAVTGNQIHNDTQWPVDLDVVFPDRKKLAPAFYQENQRFNRKLRRKSISVRDWKKNKEQHVILRIASVPGEGYFWVMYPRTADEAAPKIKRMAPGVLQIKQPEGTDYVFVSPSHFSFKGKLFNARGIAFEGSTGSVRIQKDRVILALTGGEGRVAWKGYELKGRAPLEKTFLFHAKTKKEMPTPKIRFPLPALPATSTVRKPAPGVSICTRGGITSLQMDAPDQPVSFRDKTFQIYARRAFIEQRPDSVRFVAPDAVYVKLIAGTVGIRGLGPFDLTFTRTAITGNVAGRQRSLAMTWPEDLTRPMFHLDKRRWFAGWADDHCIGKNWPTPQFAISVGVLAGKHTMRVEEWTYPELPPSPPRREVR